MKNKNKKLKTEQKQEYDCGYCYILNKIDNFLSHLKKDKIQKTEN